MRKILIVNPYYYPGFRSGGPQQTFMNVIDAYGDEFQFYVLTLNHDLGSNEVYDGIKKGWNNVGKAKVTYVSDAEMNINTISEIAKEMDLVYAGGLFEKTTIFALLAKWMKRMKCPLYVAPMGVFSEGAIRQKNGKKKLFLELGKLLRVFNAVNWSFTSELEFEDFQRNMGMPQKYVIASDIPRKPVNDLASRISGREDELKIIFLSRICAKKNTSYAIEVLACTKGNIQFDIYGIKEDMAYWKECERKLQELPENIKWTYKGEVESSKVIDVFVEYDIFLFPTLGENFGHVIYESLAGGCIPVISDTTPWNDLEGKKCGNVVSLEDKKKFVNVLQQYVEMSDDEMRLMKKNCIREAARQYEKSVEAGGYQAIFSGEGIRA